MRIAPAKCLILELEALPRVAHAGSRAPVKILVDNIPKDELRPALAGTLKTSGGRPSRQRPDEASRTVVV